MTPLLTAEQERLLSRAARAGSEHAKSTMIERNQGLVWRAANRMPVSPGLDRDDLVAEGMAGLMTAVERFDPDRGYRFSTCASWWIRQTITRACYVSRYPVRLPAPHKGVFPDPENNLSRPASMEAIEKDSNFEPSIEPKLSPVLELTDLMQAVLTEREQYIIQLRYALGGGKPCTLLELASELDCTSERVRQIEELSLSIMKQAATCATMFEAKRAAREVREQHRLKKHHEHLKRKELREAKSKGNPKPVQDSD